MEKLQGKVAIVTGASKGIGAGIAKAFAAAGAAVIVNYAGSKEGADLVVSEIMKNGGRAAAIQANVSKEADVKRLFEETKRLFGPIDILVNNASIFRFATLEAITEDEFHSHFNTNVLGPILTSKEAVQHFGTKGGNIINISSTEGINPSVSALLYAATKSATGSMTRVMAKELGGRNIRVNAIAPGTTETEGTQAIGAWSQIREHAVSMTPLGRVGQPEDIARAAVFLASDEAAWITGDTILVSGGLL
ncbi:MULTISPECIES: SDR family NAD(P)-dependent oxidoreductase [unclassified Paenibacillus]|uniref:SDR family NAD(P)-dependent oxidoreductase n=1 Tax=Paenibacillus TaxID=44249 RepID=UPI00038F92EA|nr:MULTISPECIES: glucose 1-dehydrogenase [unclassified Paenibacillus]KKC46854.1 oxidoreductase [Paenibacillus sp. D9]CDN43652.1 Uncharacterized oxidoreductase MexAM1_META1p0182 [Paenibacillus sp. P22]